MYRSLIDRIERRGLGGAVSMPGVPLLELPVPEIPNIPVHTAPTQPAKQPEGAASLSGVVLSKLTSLKPESSELKEQRSTLISSAAELLAQCDALVTDCENERRTNLERRHDAIRAEGRKQVALIKKLEKGEGEALRFWNQAHETRQERQADLEQALEAQRGLGQWASKREEVDAQIAVQQAREALKAAISADAEALQSYNAAASAHESARATLAEWGKQEAQLRAEIAGLPHYDAITSLEVR